MLLKPYRVLDLTGRLGFIAGKVVGDLGADVIKIEQPGGDPARLASPRLSGESGPPISLYWLAYNANKRGITLNLETEAGRKLFLELVRKTDFIFETFQPGTLEAWGIGYDALKEINPSLILVSITPFGQQPAYANFLASDLEIMAMSGAMSLAGEEDGEPMRVTVGQAPMWVGTEAAMGALTALGYRSMTGTGQHVDVSAQAAVIAALSHAPAFWDLNGINPERAGIHVTGRSVTGAKMRVMWPCKDGWINFIIYGGAAGRHTNQQLMSWMAETGFDEEWLNNIDWDKFQVTNITQEKVDRLESAIGKFLLTLTKQEFLEGAIKRQMLGYPVSTVEDILRDPQLSARGFWHEMVEPVTGKSLKFPGGFAIINGERLPIEKNPPRPGEHNKEIYIQEMGMSPEQFAELEKAEVI